MDLVEKGFGGNREGKMELQRMRQLVGELSNRSMLKQGGLQNTPVEADALAGKVEIAMFEGDVASVRKNLPSLEKVRPQSGVTQAANEWLKRELNSGEVQFNIRISKKASKTAKPAIIWIYDIANDSLVLAVSYPPKDQKLQLEEGRYYAIVTNVKQNRGVKSKPFVFEHREQVCVKIDINQWHPLKITDENEAIWIRKDVDTEDLP
ncbi:MAG: hypothetical protein ACLFWL_19275 [Candidatus Brocadiia bacterium]